MWIRSDGKFISFCEKKDQNVCFHKKAGHLFVCFLFKVVRLVYRVNPFRVVLVFCLRPLHYRVTSDLTW